MKKELNRLDKLSGVFFEVVGGFVLKSFSRNDGIKQRTFTTEFSENTEKNLNSDFLIINFYNPEGPKVRRTPTETPSEGAIIIESYKNQKSNREAVTLYLISHKFTNNIFLDSDFIEHK